MMEPKVVITFFEDVPRRIIEEMAKQIVGALKENAPTKPIDEWVESVTVEYSPKTFLDNAEAEAEEDGDEETELVDV